MDIAELEFAYVPTTGVRRAHETFWCDGGRGLYLHPNIWHGALVPLDDEAEFLDRQGRVHARVSVDFPKEFGCYIAAPMRRPEAARP